MNALNTATNTATLSENEAAILNEALDETRYNLTIMDNDTIVQLYGRPKAQMILEANNVMMKIRNILSVNTAMQTIQ